MAHPFSSQAQASQKARLKRLGGTAGKSYGASSMYKKRSYPSKGAGSSTPMTISGGKSKSRPDRMAFGGAVGGEKKKKRAPHATTNIIISHAGGRGGSGGGGGAGPARPGVAPVPVPVNRPVPVPVGAAGPPVPAGPAAPVRPPLPVGGPPAGPPPVGGPPVPPMRPPGMKTGGAVKKAATGGFLKESSGKAYPGFPHSPTTKAESTVSAHKDGGGVKKRQFGGGLGGGGLGGTPAPNLRADTGGGAGGAGLIGPGPGRAALPPQSGVANVSGREAIPFPQPVTVPMPAQLGARLTRPAPGTTTTFAKKGGSIPHEDEAQDKKLIEEMIGKEEEKEKGYARGGAIKTPVKNASGGGAGGKARLAKTSAAKSVPDKTEKGSPNPGRNQTARGMAGSKYYQEGKGER